MRYETLDHTADLLLRSHGSTLEECYGNMCYGMFDQTVDLSGVRPLEERTFEEEGVDAQDALYSLLSDLLFAECADGMAFCEFHVSIDGNRVSCIARGEPLDPSRMTLIGEIKAVTFHGMEIDPETPSVTVLFDIRPSRPGQGSKITRDASGAPC